MATFCCAETLGNYGVLSIYLYFPTCVCLSAIGEEVQMGGGKGRLILPFALVICKVCLRLSAASLAGCYGLS